mmetsp:Transcript_15591/g.10960  ORF Transcript_15591/g.10960 Transcript_15591/m.10960 type:complete len:157 (-) Transcript_15591:606-1076(-)
MEFKAYSEDYYHGAITDGRITVNNKKVGIDYRVRDGDKIVHKTKRCETPVVNDPIKILADLDEFLVVNKPSSIPVHPCGNFHYNSLSKILEVEKMYKAPGGFLGTVHRLDRQTSGIVFFAKNQKCSNEFREAIQNNCVSKVYFARVKGDFSKVCDE